VTTKSQSTGMQGVYLVAAQLARQGLIVSPTSRSAKGADLLVTDESCQVAFSVQVKTNAANTSYWLVGEHARGFKSSSHLYVLVNLTKDRTVAEYFVVPSETLSGLVKESRHERSTWLYVDRKDVLALQDAWHSFFPKT
jgi:hypothetical protein